VAAVSVAPILGQVVKLPNVKLVERLAFVPVLGTGKVIAALPAFSTVTVCGLSELVVPACVEAKLSAGGSTKSSFTIDPPEAMV